MALVLFLRGVNVGGRRSFRPSVLAEELKRYDVVNVGAAGTLVVRQPISRTRLRAQVEKRLPFDAKIVIVPGQEILGLMAREPFPDPRPREDVVRFVSVLTKRPRLAPSTPASIPARGRWLVKILARDGRFIFGLYRRHMKTIGCLGKLDELYGVPVTTRSWNTFIRIARALGHSGPQPAS